MRLNKVNGRNNLRKVFPLSNKKEHTVVHLLRIIENRDQIPPKIPSNMEL